MYIEKNKKINFIDAINLSIFQEMKKNNKLIAYGLGINDPKRIFGSTKKLVEKFGNERVFDVPTSENSLTGIGLGFIAGRSFCFNDASKNRFFLISI